MPTGELKTPPQAARPAADAKVEGAGGLSEAEAARRLAEYGENALAEHHISVLERLRVFFGGPSLDD